jgi:hypothetical protein
VRGGRADGNEVVIVRPCGQGFEYVAGGRGYYCDTMDSAIRAAARRAKKAGTTVRVLQ